MMAYHTSPVDTLLPGLAALLAVACHYRCVWGRAVYLSARLLTGLVSSTVDRQSVNVDSSLVRARDGYFSEFGRFGCVPFSLGTPARGSLSSVRLDSCLRPLRCQHGSQPVCWLFYYLVAAFTCRRPTSAWPPGGVYLPCR